MLCIAAIDLNPQDDTVQRGDLLTYRAPQTGFDVVVLSLVVNFEGDPRKRGDMIRAARALLAPTGLGLVFFVLPLACVENSRFPNNLFSRNSTGQLFNFILVYIYYRHMQAL